MLLAIALLSTLTAVHAKGVSSSVSIEHRASNLASCIFEI